MTKIYIYCLFSDNALTGVYSSLKSAHRDAVKQCNTGRHGVFVLEEGTSVPATLKAVKTLLTGEFDVKVDYFSDNKKVSVIKTKLKE